nr:hypothetical protein [Tanacetum cinerariifolium]
MESTGPGNVIARRVTDDLVAFSGETAVPKYMKFFLVQKVAETRRFVNRMREEADAIRSCIAQKTAVIAELQAMEDKMMCMIACWLLRMLSVVKRVSYWHCMRVSITKDQRLIAELEALGQRADVLKSLEYMRDMVARDSARVGILEQLLAGAHVRMRLKAEYATDMGETI